MTNHSCLSWRQMNSVESWCQSNGAAIYGNAIMHAGRAEDTFYKENLVWLSRATNWAKFSAIAGLGVIHRGHLQQSRSVMAPYLPQGVVVGVLTLKVVLYMPLALFMPTMARESGNIFVIAYEVLVLRLFNMELV